MPPFRKPPPLLPIPLALPPPIGVQAPGIIPGGVPGYGPVPQPAPQGQQGPQAPDERELEVIRRNFRGALGDAARAAVRRVEPFMFRTAGRMVPREVTKAIERFRKLPTAVRAQQPLWIYLLGPMGTPAMKFEGAEVQLSTEPPPDRQGQRCQNCQHFYLNIATGVTLCSHVKGAIPGSAWCNRWTAPMPAHAYAAYQDPK